MNNRTRVLNIAARLTVVLAATSALAACSLQDQSTPEPNDRAKFEQIAEQLGMDMTYDPNSVEMTVKQPDGPILLNWEDRRAHTLNGTLPAWEVKADFNPGSIANTLAWEKQAEKTSEKQHMEAIRATRSPLENKCNDLENDHYYRGPIPPACLAGLGNDWGRTSGIKAPPPPQVVGTPPSEIAHYSAGGPAPQTDAVDGASPSNSAALPSDTPEQAKQGDACRQRQQDAEFALADPRKLDAFIAQHPCKDGNINGR